VRCSFTVAWKNARAKAPYTAEESLVKPAQQNFKRFEDFLATVLTIFTNLCWV